jgi:hypothetical protein
MSNVHALPGFSVPDTGPVAEVVALLEEALEQAREGKLQGVAIVTVERNPDAFETMYHGAGARHTLAAGAMALVWQLGRAMSEHD